MGRTAILATTVVGAAAIGGFFYLSSSMESEVRAQVDAFITGPDIEAKISYDELKVSLLSGTATITGITFDRENQPEQDIQINQVDLDIGFKPFSGTATLDGFQVTGVSFKDANSKLTLASARLAGNDLPTILEGLKNDTVTHWPFTFVEIQGAHVEAMPNNNPAQYGKFNLGTARIAASNDGQYLDELLIEGFDFEAPNEVKAAIGHYQIKGFNLSWIHDLIAFQNAKKGGEETVDELKESLVRSLASASMNYMDIDSFAIRDFSMGAGELMTFSFKEMSVKDLVRPAGMVLGGTMKLEALEIKGMQNTSPQAMQIMTLADLDTIRMDMASVTSFDKATATATTATDLALDGLIKLRSEGSLVGIDAEKMSAKMIAYQTEQLNEMFDAFDGIVPPEQDPWAQFAEVLSLYSGYFEGFDLTLGLEDQGLLSRGFRVYSALSGMPEDQLRQQFTMMAIAQSAPLLGEGAPDNLSDVITNFMAENSQPLQVSLRSLVPMTEEATAGITPQTWHEVFGLELNTVEPSGTPASK